LDILIQELLTVLQVVNMAEKNNASYALASKKKASEAKKEEPKKAEEKK